MAIITWLLRYMNSLVQYPYVFYPLYLHDDNLPSPPFLHAARLTLRQHFPSPSLPFPPLPSPSFPLCSPSSRPKLCYPQAELIKNNNLHDILIRLIKTIASSGKLDTRSLCGK